MARPQFQTDYRLWAAFVAGLFVAMSFVDPWVGVAKGENSLWAWVGRFVRGDYICSTPDMVVPILMRSAFQVAVAVPLGWAVQAVIVVLLGPRKAAQAEGESALAPEGGAGR